MNESGREQIVVISGRKRPLTMEVLDAARDALTVDLVRLNGSTKTQLDQHVHKAAAFVLEYDSFAETVEMVRELRQRYGAEPILALTDEQDEDRLLEAYVAGANDCISSTVGPALLIAKVRVWLRWAQLQRRGPSAAQA